MEATKTDSLPIDLSNNDAINHEKTELSSDAVVDDKEASVENSDYDSADSYTDDEQDGKIRSRSRASDQENHSNSDTGGSLILEREEGDGQESVPLKKVDDDEDKKNPQYIPKRGTFYEHDDRTADNVEPIDPIEIEKEKEAKKKVWQDKKEKWRHDRFNDTEQAPKSRSELIAIYGYDIRNEEGPPRARRRRRYGRGPNKYTRNWEDEDAYNKPAPARTKKPPVRPKKTTEEFPPLVRNKSETPERTIQQLDDPTPTEQIINQKPTESRNEPNRDSYVKQTPPIANDSTSHSRNIPPEPTPPKSNLPRPGSGRIVKPKKEIKDSDYRGFTTKTRQQRNIKPDPQRVQPPRNQQDFIQSQNFTNKNNVQELEKDMGKLSVDSGFKGAKHGGQRQGSVPPRLQSEQKGSKRYSSMRQRSLPEANTPPVPNYQHTSFYPNDYNQQAASTTPQQPLLHQNPQMLPTTAQLPPAPLPPIAQVPVTAAPLLPGPFPQAFPQPPPAFLQPAVPPPPFIPPQGQIINYVQGQPAFTPNFQSYQQQFNSVAQPTELYQPQGGITYYSTDQQVAQRSIPQKRPKAAIPIVAPPTEDEKGIIPHVDESDNRQQEINEAELVQQ